MRDPTSLSRRALLKGGAFAAALLPLSGREAPAAAEVPPNADPWRGLKVGVASYTLRKLPLDAAIQAIQRVGLKYVSIKDFHLPLEHGGRAPGSGAKIQDGRHHAAELRQHHDGK